jgi:hypothetical protein
VIRSIVPRFIDALPKMERRAKINCNQLINLIDIKEERID